MKKLFIPLCALLILSVASCNSKGKSMRPDKFDTLRFSYSWSLIDGDTTSPSYEGDIVFIYLNSQDSLRARTVNDSIMKSAFDITGLTPQAALDSFLKKEHEEFISQREDYLKAVEKDEPAASYYRRLLLSAMVEPGRNSEWNYTLSNYRYTGGAHGDMAFTHFNFDSISGHNITMDEAFGANYQKPLGEKILQAIYKKEGASSIAQLNAKGYLIQQGNLPLPQNFFLQKDSVEFMYNHYEIACYAKGIVEVKLSYDELKGLLKE